MKQFMLACVAAVAVGSGSGCCCLEKMFCCKPWSGCGSCCDSCCDDCGCDSCGGNSCGCNSCGGGCDSCGVMGGTPGGCQGGNCGIAHSGHGGGCGPNGCGCGHHGGLVANPGMRNGGGPGGPPTAGVTYPYYTNRGPRDFLAKNPPSIGP